MASLNEGKIVRDALAAWEDEFRTLLGDFLRSDPARARRGVVAYLEPPQTARDRREERSRLVQLGSTDPSGQAYESALTERINATSFAETLDMLRQRHNRDVTHDMRPPSRQGGA